MSDRTWGSSSDASLVLELLSLLSLAFCLEPKSEGGRKRGVESPGRSSKHLGISAAGPFF
ncbi:hypothetical protein CGRA01v4_10011 [Colletotrichum graminicola]|nr:hypothetical protein CGRA01v4_10011 [Colletotrichum graminicola]